MEELNELYGFLKFLYGFLKFIAVFFVIDCLIMLWLDEDTREYIWKKGHWK